MEIKRVFEKTEEIEEKINNLKQQIQELNNQKKEIREICSHDIVFKYNDNQPRKMIVDGNYYCPACETSIECFQNNQIKNTPFRNSRIINLSSLSILGTKEVHHKIRNEVYQNIDLYYHSDYNVEELTDKMIEILEDYQIENEKPEKVLRKNAKNN